MCFKETSKGLRGARMSCQDSCETTVALGGRHIKASDDHIKASDHHIKASDHHTKASVDHIKASDHHIKATFAL